jgi:Fe-S oxidoreductase
MEEADSCCGFGGSFSLYFYDLSREINAEKMKHIQATKAERVVTSCPGCMIHIADGIAHIQGKQSVVHIVQLLAQALREQKKI